MILNDMKLEKLANVEHRIFKNLLAELFFD